MAANTNVITQLTVGQKEKEVTINTNYLAIPRYLGEFTTAAQPAVTGVSQGSTYYNTTTSKLMFLNTSNAWINVA